MSSMVPLRALVSLVAAFNRRGIVSPGARTVAFIAVDAAVAIAVVAVPVRPVVARTVAAGSLRPALVPRQVSLVGEALSVIDCPHCPCAALPGVPPQVTHYSVWLRAPGPHLAQ